MAESKVRAAYSVQAIEPSQALNARAVVQD